MRRISPFLVEYYKYKGGRNGVTFQTGSLQERKGCFMATIVRGKNLEITPALKDHVEKQEKKVTKYFDNEVNVQALLSVEKDRKVAEITLKVDGVVLRGVEGNDDMYAAIDLVYDKLVRQIHKYKTRIARRMKKGTFNAALIEGPAVPEESFEVARVKHAPFIVNTKHIKTCVLGTKFNVRAREEEGRVVTTLLQGSVRMESPRTVNNGYLLKPGQTLNINTTTYQAELIEYAEPTEVLLWINGKLKFKQHSLLEITNIMEKLYDLKFVYDDESLKTERFTGEFSTDNLPDEILNVLMHTNHFSYKKEGRIIRLSKK